MEIRSYTDSDWQAVRDIYDLSKPDEMRGSVNLAAIRPLEGDPEHLALFHDSNIVVMEESDTVVGFAGHKENHISWVYVHPVHRRRGVASALVREVLNRLDGTVTLNVGRNNLGARALYQCLGFPVINEATQRATYECRICGRSWKRKLTSSP